MKTPIRITFALLFIAGPGMLIFAQKSVYTLPFENQTRLPALDVYINMESISSSYQSDGQVFTSEINGPGDESLEQVSTSYNRDDRVVDAIRFLNYYLEEQLLMPGNTKSGTVEMNVIYLNERYSFSAGAVLGVLTLGFGMLLGIPYARCVTDVELEAIFYDPSGYMLSKYRGVGHCGIPQNLYGDMKRKSHQKAFKEALGDLNARIMSDSSLPALISQGKVDP